VPQNMVRRACTAGHSRAGQGRHTYIHHQHISMVMVCRGHPAPSGGGDAPHPQRSWHRDARGDRHSEHTAVRAAALLWGAGREVADADRDLPPQSQRLAGGDRRAAHGGRGEPRRRMMMMTTTTMMMASARTSREHACMHAAHTAELACLGSAAAGVWYAVASHAPRGLLLTGAALLAAAHGRPEETTAPHPGC
jgi:hypothetical protein